MMRLSNVLIDQLPRPRHGPTVLGLIASLVVACGAPAASPGRSTAPVATVDPIASGSPTALASVDPSPRESAEPTGWVPAASMLRGRHGFDAVLLGDGTVLAVGDDYACQPGAAIEGSERAELYDPAADTWTEVEGLNKPRKSPATIALRDGSAIVVGGINSADYPFSSTKIFSPATRSWRDGPLLGLARGDPLAAALGDGRVLVVSDTGSRSSRVTSEIYDPSAGAWSGAASPPAYVSILQLATLTDDPEDRVIAVAWDRVDSEPQPAILVYGAVTDAWSRIDAPRAFFGFGLVALPGRGALAIGGGEGGELAGGDATLADVDRLDPDAGRWKPVASMGTPRLQPQVVALQDGRVLVAGGASAAEYQDGAHALQTTEIYDPSTDHWAAGPDLLEPRMRGNAVVLQDGSVLLLGGTASFNTEGETPYCPPPLTSVERFYPGS
jgi:hypothetical protein